MGHAVRLTPTMRSRKLQVLDFIKRYFAQWGRSPSLEEIGAAFDPPISKQRVSYYVHQLSVEKMINVTAGQRRGISLVDSAEEISMAELLVRLRKLGVNVNALGPLGAPDPLTELGLTALPYLDHE